jgi:hypothetical protein
MDEAGEFEDEFEDEFESEDEILEAGVDGRPDAEIGRSPALRAAVCSSTSALLLDILKSVEKC